MKRTHYFAAATHATFGPLVVALLAATAHGQFTFTDVADEPSLVALWELDEPTGAASIADATGVFTGTVFGGTTLGVPSAMTTLGTAAHFNGSTGRIDIPYSAALNPESYTIQAWAQVQGSAGSYRSPLTSRSTGALRGGYIFYAHRDNYWDYWVGTDTGWEQTSGPAVIMDQWVHLAATYDSGSDAKVLYLNGHPVATSTEAAQPNTASPLRIGAGESEGPGDYWFHGAVDNVAVLNQALAHQNIANHYNAKSIYANQVAADGPAAYWRLGEQAGSNAYNALDVTSHTGTYSNVALRQMDTPLANDIDTAASFAHGSARVSVPHDDALNPAESFTIEAWARVDGGQGDYRSVLTSRDGGGGRGGFVLYADRHDHWAFWNGTGDGAWHSLEGSNVEIGEWVHLVGSYDADTQVKNFYVNGIRAASEAGVNYAPNRNNDLFIGMGGDTGTQYPFNGLIDEVAVYGHALTPGAVSRHFLVASTGADVIRWDGGGANLLWSTPDNWDPAGSPADRIAVFDNTAASGTSGTVTNTVDGNYTVASINYENTGANYHTTVVGPGNTLVLESASGSPRIFVAEEAQIDGRLGGNQGLVKTGDGTLTLAGSNVYTGGTSIESGRITVGNNAALGADTVTINAGGTLDLNGNDIANHITLAGGTLAVGTLATVSSTVTLEDVAGNTIEVTGNYRNLAGQLTGPGSVIVTGASTPGLILSNPANDFAGNVVIDSGAYLRLETSEVVPDTATVTVNGHLRLEQAGGTETVAGLAGDGAIWIPTSTAGSYTLQVGAGDTSSSFAGTIGRSGQNNAISLVKIGDGTLTLSGHNHYTGDTIVDGGTLVLNRGGSLDAGDTGQFQSSGNTIIVNSGASLRLATSWVMGDGGQHHLVANGGTLQFYGTSNYQSHITLTGGAITTGDSERPWRTGNHGGDGLIIVNPSDVPSTISGSLCFVRRTGVAHSTTFFVADGPAEHDLIVSSVIFDHPGDYDGMVLMKDGPGTMVLEGASTFNGGVDVADGTLLVNNTSGSGTGTGPVTVRDGATLGGTGAIAGAATIEGGATLATELGDDPLNFGDDLILADGAVWDWEFIDDAPGNYGQAVGPNLILPEEGAITLNIRGLEGHAVDWYDQFTLFTGEVENFDAGLFHLEDHSDWDWGWSISVDNGLLLTAVPEPGAWILLISALACGLLARRRRTG